MIGLGVMFERLTYLEIETKKVNATVNEEGSVERLPKSALWHFRLGHLSTSRMKLMNVDSPFVKLDEGSICEIYHYGRHKKLPYCLTPSKASKYYDIIHLDIWGPISTPSIHGHKYF